MDIQKRMKRKNRPFCAAVIVAAGSASRMRGVDKIMAPLGGEPVILRTLRVFQNCEAIDEIIVVTRDDLVMPMNHLCTAGGISKKTQIVVGGDERTESVMTGLSCVSERTLLVAIHDGARPLASQELITKVVEKAAQTGAAAPAVPVTDTIKVARRGVIEATPDRSTLMAVQTPQVFDVDLIRGALYKARQEEIPLTDDCSAVERLGMKVHLTEGSYENRKITTPIDLILAEAILSGKNTEEN